MFKLFKRQVASPPHPQEIKKIHNVVIIDGTDDVVRMEDITIPDDFQAHKPYIGKINKYASYYRRHGRFDKPITVIAFTNEFKQSTELLLVDGYARYEVARLFGFKWIPIRYMDISEYIEK